MTTTAIVLDGNQRAALAVVRSLGKRGLRIVVCSSKEKALAGASRWCRGTYAIPSAETDPDTLVPALRKIIKQENASIVFPITDASVMALVGRKDIEGALIACPPEESYRTVSDKAALVRRALDLGVRAPRSTTINTADDFRTALRDWAGPVVIKPAVSRYRSDGHVKSTSVVLAEDPDEALALMPELDWLEVVPCLLQEYIPGHGAGIFAIYGRGGAVEWFSHRRVREKPPSGGVSVLCESAPLDTEMLRHAQALLDDANWLGPAMVEFRVDLEGQPWLMEINGRFWGSLQLSVDCGLDMPWLWYEIITGKSPRSSSTYKIGSRLRWLLGDLDSLYLALRTRGLPAGEKIMAVMRFLNFFERRTRLEVLRFADPRPFARELGAWLSSTFRRVKRRKPEV